MSIVEPSETPGARRTRAYRARKGQAAAVKPPTKPEVLQSRSVPMNGMSGWVTPALTREEYLRQQAAAKPPVPRVRQGATLERQSIRRIGGPDWSDTVRY